MLSLPPEEAGWELGGPGHPRGPGAGACLELLLQGGALMPNANDEERSEGGRGLCSPSPPLLLRGDRIKQQQKHHPLGDYGLHPLPSLRSGFCLPHIPCSPLWLPQGPLHSGGTLWLARGSTAQSLGSHFPQLLIPPGSGEERAWGLLPGADGIALALPAGCGTAQTPALPPWG